MSEARRGEVVLADIAKRYGDAVAVERISLRIEPGTLLSLVGPSGCGKTTTLRMIAGLEIPSGGTITVGGRDVTRLPPSARDVSMVFQSYALFPHLDVLANVSYGLESKGLPRAEAAQKARDGLALVGLATLEARLPSELSGGQQQRVALARALVLEPQVLLFDEPLSNLDAKLRRKMRLEIRQIQQRVGITAVYVTHDRDEALAISDSILVMDQGRVVQSGTPREIYERPESQFVAQFMGEANVLDGALTRAEGATKGRVQIGPFALDLDHRGLSGGPVKVVVRPESVRLDRGGEGAPGEVLAAAYLGDRIEYEVKTAAGELFVVARDLASPFEKGQSVRVVLEPWGAALLP